MPVKKVTGILKPFVEVTYLGPLDTIGKLNVPFEFEGKKYDLKLPKMPYSSKRKVIFDDGETAVRFARELHKKYSSVLRTRALKTEELASFGKPVRVQGLEK